MIMFVVVFVIGALLGNFASTVLYRLPKNIPINGFDDQKGKLPHCSSCGSVLKFYEYLPILSWCFSRGSCNYCGVKIDQRYFKLEFFSAILAVLLYAIYGDSEQLILMTFIGVGFILFSFLQDNRVLYPVIVLSLINRVLHDGSIISLSISLCASFVLYMWLKKITKKDYDPVVFVLSGAFFHPVIAALYCGIYSIFSYSVSKNFFYIIPYIVLVIMSGVLLFCPCLRSTCEFIMLF